MVEIFNDFGLAVGLIVVLVVSGLAAVRWIAKLLFSDVEDRDGRPRGYVSRLVRSHCDTLESVKESADSNADCMRGLAAGLARNDDDHKRIANAAHHAATALPVIGRALPTADQKELRDIQLRTQAVLGGVTGYTKPPDPKQPDG